MMTVFSLSRVAICAVVSAEMLAFPAFAHADSRDDQFLAAVSARGIGGQPDSLLATPTLCVT